MLILLLLFSHILVLLGGLRVSSFAVGKAPLLLLCIVFSLFYELECGEDGFETV